MRWMGAKGLELPGIMSDLILVLSTVLRSSMLQVHTLNLGAISPPCKLFLELITGLSRSSGKNSFWVSDFTCNNQKEI